MSLALKEKKQKSLSRIENIFCYLTQEEKISYDSLEEGNSYSQYQKWGYNLIKPTEEVPIKIQSNMEPMFVQSIL